MPSTKEYLEKLVQEKGVPYLDVRFYAHGKDLFSYVCGDNREIVTGEEKLFLWSCTKIFTACLAVKLMEEDYFSLDDEVEKYIPEFKSICLLDNNGKKKKPNEKMLVKHLLTMTGGFSYDIDYYGIPAFVEENGGDATTEEIILSLGKYPLLFSPGERFNYSLCLDVIALVIERATGISFDEAMKKYILQPLGLKNTSFVFDESELAPTYVVKDGKVEKTKNHNWLIFSPSYRSGGAGLVSTIGDLERLGKMLLKKGKWDEKQILSEESVNFLHEVQSFFAEVHDTFTCVQGEDYGYGLGVRVRLKDTEWGLKKGEFGWDGAAGTYLLVDQENDTVVTIGMNVLSWPIIFKGEHLSIVKRLYEEFLALP